LARARGNPLEQPIGLVAPSVLTGKDREADQVLRRQGIGVRCRIIGGGVGPHDQAGGVVGGEEVAAVVGIGVVAIERRLPGQCAFEMGLLAGRLVKRQRGPDHGGVIRGVAGRGECRSRSPWAILASTNRKARAAISSQCGSSNTRPALTSAAIIRPFQSASTLSSRPGRTRLPRAISNVSRIGASFFSSSMLRGKCLRRLRILCPSKLPPAVTS